MIGLPVVLLHAAEAQHPAAPSPAPSEAKPSGIEQGDSLKVTVYREAYLSGDFVVDSSGNISYPLVGIVKVENQPIEVIRQQLMTNLRKYIIDPQISITHNRKIKEVAAGGSTAATADLLPSESFTIIGEVRNPGAYEISDSMTLTKAIAEAAGLTPLADLKKVKIIRNVDGKQAVNFYAVEKINNAEAADPNILPGDKIVVNPEEKDINTAAILGEVKIAGMYEVTPSFTLMKLIAKAGGFTPIASTSKVRVVREEGGQKKILVYNAGAIIGGVEDDPVIKPGDMVFVPESFF